MTMSIYITHENTVQYVNVFCMNGNRLVIKINYTEKFLSVTPLFPFILILNSLEQSGSYLFISYKYTVSQFPSIYSNTARNSIFSLMNNEMIKNHLNSYSSLWLVIESNSKQKFYFKILVKKNLCVCFFFHLFNPQNNIYFILI